MLVEEHNIFCIAAGKDNRLSLADAVDSVRLAKVLTSRSSFYSEKKEELIEAYLFLCRSGEEIHMLKCDMQNAIHYYENKVNVLETAIKGPLDIPEECKSGACALLSDLLQDTQRELAKLRKLFCEEELYPQSMESDSDFSSDNDTDYDSDDD